METTHLELTPQQARSIEIRRIIAEVCDRSLGGTREGTRIRADLDLRGWQEDEIAWRIRMQLGVRIKPSDWSDFSTVKDLIGHVEVAIQREATGRE